jgi:hypothetical protein
MYSHCKPSFDSLYIFFCFDLGARFFLNVVLHLDKEINYFIKFTQCTILNEIMTCNF